MFSDNLRHCISQSGIKPRHLAEKTGVTVATIYAYVRKKNPTSPKLNWVFRAAEVLGVDVEALISSTPAAKAAETAESDGETLRRYSESE